MKQTSVTPKTRAPEPQAETAIYSESMLNLFPYHYVHVIDTNTNITELVIGPKNLRLTKNLRIVVYCKAVGRSYQNDPYSAYALRQNQKSSLH